MKDKTAVGEICKFAPFLTEGLLCIHIAPVGEVLKSCCLSPINRGERERAREILEEIVAKNISFLIKKQNKTDLEIQEDL